MRPILASFLEMSSVYSRLFSKKVKFFVGILSCGGGECGSWAQETAQTGGFYVGLKSGETAGRLFAAGGMFRRLQDVFNGVAGRLQGAFLRRLRATRECGILRGEKQKGGTGKNWRFWGVLKNRGLTFNEL